MRLLHLSDIHCGRPFVAAHMEAAMAVARAGRWTAIVVSGDFTQRARAEEFAAARRILDSLRELAPVLTVPGNHDTAWWRVPFGFGDSAKLHEAYRGAICADTEPTLQLPGVSIVGLCSAWGTNGPALTWYPRDWRVKGGLTDSQLADARARLAASPAGALRVLVVHHNVVRGRLSNRWGLARPHRTLDAIAALGVDVVCTGHDHEERIADIVRPTGRFLVSAANTLSSRARGHRASAFNVIEADAHTVSATAWTYDATQGGFFAGHMQQTVARAG